MRIALATHDLARINASLAQAGHVMFFEVSAEGYRHLRTIAFRQRADASKTETSLLARWNSLKGCALAFAAGFEPETEHALARLNITPLTRFAGQPVAYALEALQAELRAAPPLWLRRIEQRCRHRVIEHRRER